ncbi:hypothetical protein E2C01_088714 [Portunus trituberculatus]|uniref:Uncharacterized protein n=1 Tax=Portunus trituberculatus TaxID=210409 RepID=A0A5B7JFE7_PORTR|nr:hypothetical protein [Portunus trituberculatus]
MVASFASPSIVPARPRHMESYKFLQYWQSLKMEMMWYSVSPSGLGCALSASTHQAARRIPHCTSACITGCGVL